MGQATLWKKTVRRAQNNFEEAKQECMGLSWRNNYCLGTRIPKMAGNTKSSYRCSLCFALLSVAPTHSGLRSNSGDIWFVSWDCLLDGPEQTQRTEQKKPQHLEKTSWNWLGSWLYVVLGSKTWYSINPGQLQVLMHSLCVTERSFRLKGANHLKHPEYL